MQHHLRAAILVGDDFDVVEIDGAVGDTAQCLDAGLLGAEAGGQMLRRELVPEAVFQLPFGINPFQKAGVPHAILLKAGNRLDIGADADVSESAWDVHIDVPAMTFTPMYYTIRAT